MTIFGQSLGFEVPQVKMCIFYEWLRYYSSHSRGFKEEYKLDTHACTFSADLLDLIEYSADNLYIIRVPVYVPYNRHLV